MSFASVAFPLFIYSLSFNLSNLFSGLLPWVENYVRFYTWDTQDRLCAFKNIEIVIQISQADKNDKDSYLKTIHCSTFLFFLVPERIN